MRQGIGDTALLSALARLTLVLALVNAAVATAANPWRQDRPSDRFPAIVQDFLVIVLFMIIGTVLLHEQLLTTSAVGAVVVGFALQDTLGNLFAGLAIQIEKPFRVGHWILIAGSEGQVQEITWRATKLRTRDGEFIIVPNGTISKETVLNYSEPTVSNAITVEVGVSYLTPPNEAKAGVLAAIANAPLAMRVPAPQVIVAGFADSAINYTAYFWVNDYGLEREARDQVRTNIWYEFRRRNLEIPWPIQIQYERTEEPVRSSQHVASAAALLGGLDLFKTLDLDTRYALSKAASEHLFAAGEAIVRQDAGGDSMFVVLGGQAQVVIEPSGQQVAVISAGGFFGEMSMLTGEPRTATVKALTDVRVLEISASEFRNLASSNPALIDHISTVVTARRSELDGAKASASIAAPEARQGLLARMKRFLSLS